jgi:REP element-mobilizing transposase RayT
MPTTLTDRHSIRLPGYDYSTSGLYFVTICSQKRECIFGEIVGEKMILNETGKIIELVWKTLPDHHSVALDEFQIMPNHIHMIIQIVSNGRDDRAPTTLGKIIAYFKYVSTKQINQHSVGAGIIPPEIIRKIFQRNYHEHVIRSEIDLEKIREYVTTNPLMWARDRNNPLY